MWDFHVKMKPLPPHHLQSINNPKPQSLHEHQQETENNPTDLENLYPQTCLKRRKDVMVSKILQYTCKFKRGHLHRQLIQKIKLGYPHLTWHTLNVSHGIHHSKCDGFKETSRNLEVFFIIDSKNERTYLTNFIAVSISNGHKTKLNSNFVLALSLSF